MEIYHDDTCSHPATLHNMTNCGLCRKERLGLIIFKMGERLEQLTKNSGAAESKGHWVPCPGKHRLRSHVHPPSLWHGFWHPDYCGVDVYERWEE